MGQGWSAAFKRVACFLLGFAFVVFAATCDASIFRDGFECADCGPPLPETCETSQDPRNLPVGFTPHVTPWEQAFNGYSYPLSGGPLAAVGSWSLKRRNDSGPSMANRYLSIPFVADGRQHKIDWALVQPTYLYPYARQGDPFVTISPCWGDFREANDLAPDAFLRKACRKGPQVQGSVFYGPTGSNVCWLNAGQTYYLNIAFHDFDTGPTCRTDDGRCETNMKHN